MKYNTFRKAAKWLAAGVMILPLLTSAQVEKITYQRPSYWRPYDQSGINVFEAPKAEDVVKYDGMRIRFGAGFTQQYQSLKQENTLAVNNATSNRLYPLTAGFMTAMANLYMDVQLADGIRLNVTTYLSARHHNEAWVKGGYIQFDKLPFKGQFWQDLMKIATIKVGHMEINYGDAHFRRSDGGHTLYNPFMESYIMDAYATEIGGEIYLQKNGVFGMLGLTNGMIKGNIDSAYATVQDANAKKQASIILKAGIDKKIGEGARLRLTGSWYHNGGNAVNGLTLYGGDRTGSNYQNVMEKAPTGSALPASTAVPFSGRFNPGFTAKIDAIMLNGFLKVKGFEFFGTYETASGHNHSESSNRTASQVGIDGLYRFGATENLFLGVRYNSAKAAVAGFTTGDITINRTAFAGGWFVSPNVLLKAEYVTQKYLDFPTTDYRAGGKFNGLVIEAVVGF